MLFLVARGFAREQKRVNARISIAVTVVCLACGGNASAVRGDEQLRSAIKLCMNSNSPVERLGACSTVISRTKDPALLGRSYNRRGHVNMALRRFQEAADDFSHVIKLNPQIAGYYDNRQNAYRSMGMLQHALKDANTAVRLAPTYAFVFRSRALVYADLAGC
jgi:tetratricopeptide (TPR) repeat protein